MFQLSHLFQSIIIHVHWSKHVLNISFDSDVSIFYTLKKQLEIDI